MVNDVHVLPLEAALEPKKKKVSERQQQLRDSALNGLKSLGWGLASMSLMISLWAIFCATIAKDLPGPLATFKALLALTPTAFSNEHDNMGVGLQIWASIKRVAVGFGLGALVAIPTGILMGSVPACRKLLDPIVQILRPVSPLVWFPLSLVAFKALGGTATATLFTIFITSVWPTLINTAFGVSSLPEDYRIVAKVFRFSPHRYVSKVLLPFALPHILTGLRLSMGIAWLVIVAAEMLSGDNGIGFFAWESYNAGSYEQMVAAVVLIGVVGLIMDRGFDWLLRRFDYA
jgi:nitrate/nitrite transport system permease protein